MDTAVISGACEYIFKTNLDGLSFSCNHREREREREREGERDKEGEREYCILVRYLVLDVASTSYYTIVATRLGTQYSYL